jgi:DNA-directed RNA polymerase subunit RPC12/RpoP
MATVEFKCPQCGQICGFHDRYVGRRARCTQCNTHFLIPPVGQSAKALKPEYIQEGPWSGYWQALLRQTPRALLNPAGMVALGAMTALSLLRFFMGHPFFVIYLPFIIVLLPLPVGIFVFAITLGIQCRFLFDIIQSTADQNDDSLPRLFEDNTVNRLFASIVSLYVFAILLAISFAPAGLVWWGLRKMAVEANWPVIIAAAAGLFVLPLSLTIYAYSRDFFLALRWDLIVRAAKKTFLPHLALYVQALAIAALFWKSTLFIQTTPEQIVVKTSVGHVLMTLLTLILARSCGLFYRHYGCYMP